MNDLTTAHAGTIAIESSRFGHVEIEAAAVIAFPDGLIGLGGLRYTLIATDAKSPFVWLQSVDDGGLALPVTDPAHFFPDFRLELSEAEARRLEIDESTAIDIFVTVRAAPVLADFVANLRAPLVVAAGVGHQVINQAPGSELRAPLLPHAENLPSSSAA
jgi:flagellar assembly factor FliW